MSNEWLGTRGQRLASWHSRMRQHVNFPDYPGIELWGCPDAVLCAPRVSVGTGPVNGAGPCVTIGSGPTITL